MVPRDALHLTRLVLRILIGANLLMGAGIAALLSASLISPTLVMRGLGVSTGPGGAGLVTGMRLIMLLGLASVPLVHVLLSRLLAVVATVNLGDPFVTENAARITTMAWSLLGIEMLHLAVGTVAAAAPLPLDWNFSVTRWLAVLLLFVLGRVFEHGARMREDLEGTV
jgi:hypothetical protein